MTKSWIAPIVVGAVQAATTLTNVACNGKDKITFTLTKDAGVALGDIQTLGCPNQNGPMDSSVYTQNGDVYNFDFNPYTTCMNTPDPNNAASYSVDFKMLFSDSQTINGQTMYFSGDQVELKCTFQNTYTLTSDLGGVNLEGDQLTGEEFKLLFEMVRTQSDYSTEETGTVVANSDIFHRITSTTVSNLGATDFFFAPSEIRLEKKNASPAVNFNLFDSTMTSCGYTELGFEMNYDDSAKQWTFKYKAFLLDTEQGADYQIVATLQLCNSLSTSAECTTANNQCTGLSTFPTWPDDFAWSHDGEPSGYSCMVIGDSLSPASEGWPNHFCWRSQYGPIDGNGRFQWSENGPIDGMTCVLTIETIDFAHGWDNNHICYPTDYPYNLAWSLGGPLGGKECIQWLEPNDPHTWTDNYLCGDRYVAP